jgi:hypothetical protein
MQARRVVSASFFAQETCEAKAARQIHVDAKTAAVNLAKAVAPPHRKLPK